MIRGVACPWCKHFWHEVAADLRCGRCGGALPAPPGPTRGPAPPSGPRTLPDAYVRSLLVWNSNMGLLGAAWGAFGVLFLVLGTGLLLVFPPVGCVFAPFGLIFLLVGIVVYRSSRRGPLRQIAALTRGVAAEADIVSVRKGSEGWEVEYEYRVDGRALRGKTIGQDIAHSIRQRGEPLWVVYLPEDPSACSVWPPMR